MPLADLLPYFQLVGQVALVVGAAVAVYQLIQLRQTQRQEAALRVVTGLNTPEFRQAFATVNELPLGATAQQVRDGGAGMEAAAGTVMMTFETLGVLVHNRVVPLDVVDQVIGGFLRESWRRLGNYMEWKRKAIGYPRWGEWYQWLFDRMATDQRRAVGAYEAFREWQP